MQSPQQLSLDISPQARYRLDDFIQPQADDSQLNLPVVALLKAMACGEGELQCFLYAPTGFGKTHLLQAACVYANEYKQSESLQATGAAYCPLDIWQAYDVDVLNHLEGYSLIALDNVDVCAGKPDWERALFNLINRCRASNTRLLFSANDTPEQLGVSLADLRSRLQWGAVVQIADLTDEQKMQWMQWHSQRLGFVLSDSACAYLIKHGSRHRAQLLQLFEQLNAISLEQKKKITVPLLKSILK